MSADARAPGRVLIVAGSDSGGGAGIQGDIKTVSALGGYAATAITALTAQNTLGVHGVFDIPADFVAQQMRNVLEDIGVDCIKTGMLNTCSVIGAVADVLDACPSIPLILDPVALSKSGAVLLREDGLEYFIARLIPKATLLTPNLPEAAALLSARSLALPDLESPAGREIACRLLLGLGTKAILLKGGHGAGDALTDMLVMPDRPPVMFHSTRIPTRHTHGTGCAYASAIATFIAQGADLEDAVARAHAYVIRAIEHAPGLGGGHGPLGHQAGAK